MQDIKPNVFRLISTPLVFTPGIVAWAIRMRPRKAHALLRDAYPGLTKEACTNLCAGRYEVQGDAVVVKG